MREERILIPCGGIHLEGLLNIREALSANRGVILCHPHPLYGGDMDNPVIATAARAAAGEGFATLRFNFRGVGRSEGSYGEGIGERSDVEAAIELMCSKLGHPDSSIVLLGYSFGVLAGFPAAIPDKRIKGLVGIAPPLTMYDFGFLLECSKPKLFIAGDRDLYCPAQLLEDWYQKLSEPKSLAIVPGADHFFSSHLQALTDPLRSFFNSFR